MTELPIVRRLAEMADHESGLSPIVKLRDEHIADVRQAAALIRELVAAGDALLTGTTNSCLNGDEYFRDNDDVRTKIKAFRAALSRAKGEK